MTQAFGREAHAANAAVSAIGGNQPRSLSVVHYGPDGSRVASTGTATYAGLTGSGAVVRYESKRAGGVPHASSSIQIDAEGRAQNASTELLNPDESPLKTVKADYSGVFYNEAGRVVSGRASYAIADPGGAAIGTAAMAYANEGYLEYSLDKAQSVKAGATQQLRIAFDRAQLTGLKVVGGQLDITCTSAAHVPSSQSTSFLTDQGMPSLLTTSGFADDGKTVRQVSESHYGGVSFDARGRIDTGDLFVVNKDGGGVLTGGALLRFNNGALIGRWGIAPDAVAAALTRVKPVPGNDTQQVGPALVPWRPIRPADRISQTKRADGTLIEQRGDWYAPGSTGTPWRSQITGYAINGADVIDITDIDYRAAQFGPSGDPTGGTVITTRFDNGVRASITNISY